MNHPTHPDSQPSLPPRLAHAAHRLCWVGATTGAVYLAISLGAAEITGNPLAVAGLLLLGVGLVRHAKTSVGVA